MLSNIVFSLTKDSILEDGQEQTDKKGVYLEVINRQDQENGGMTTWRMTYRPPEWTAGRRILRTERHGGN